jgi:vacuolar-type H+-ATPase subunit I/STV1
MIVFQTLRGTVRTTIAIGFALGLAPAVLGAQQEDARGPLPVPEAAQELIVEMQEIQNRLRPMQQEALQTPELQAAGDSLGSRIREAMEEVEPATRGLIARLNELMVELEAAEASGDEPRFSQAIGEASEIDQILQIAQAEALEVPDVAARLEAYEAQVHRRMIDDNPDAAGLLARLDELNAELAAMLRGDG